MRRVQFITLMLALATLTLTSCSDKVETLIGLLNSVEITLEDEETGEPSFSTNVKGLAADGASKLVVAIEADTSNPATKIEITSDVDWGKVSGDETIYTINGKSYYILSLTSEEELPAALDNASVATINYTINATFSNGTTNSATKAVEVVRPPVIFAHGLASSAETFDAMLGYLKPKGLFVDAALYALDYSSTSTASYSTNNRVVPEAIDTTFAAMLSAGYVAKKATVIGHSMGGILTRIYIQDGVFNSDGATQKEPYRDDILKIITIDTPHSGSQLADFAMELGANDSPLSFFSKLGAIEDLAVESDATADLNSTTKLAIGNALKIPTHVITAEMGTLSGIIDLVKGEQYLITALSFLLDAVESKLLYGDEETSDIVVPMTSQKGGVESTLLKKYVTNYTNQWHCSVHTTQTAATDLLALLNTESSDNKTFTTGGFAPATLTYNENLTATNNGSVIVEDCSATTLPSDEIGLDIEIALNSDDEIVYLVYDGNEWGDDSTATSRVEIVKMDESYSEGEYTNGEIFIKYKKTTL
ncbi:MAG: hypothetical protein SNJ09_04185 [Rikenellaceae bacterium]